jgi:hypothetical protein
MPFRLTPQNGHVTAAASLYCCFLLALVERERVRVGPEPAVRLRLAAVPRLLPVAAGLSAAARARFVVAGADRLRPPAAVFLVVVRPICSQVYAIDVINNNRIYCFIDVRLRYDAPVPRLRGVQGVRSAAGHLPLSAATNHGSKRLRQVCLVVACHRCQPHRQVERVLPVHRQYWLVQH